MAASKILSGVASTAETISDNSREATDCHLVFDKAITAAAIVVLVINGLTDYLNISLIEESTQVTIITDDSS
jgi:hypothetical protein